MNLQIRTVAFCRRRLSAALLVASLIGAPAAWAQSGDKPADPAKGHNYTVALSAMSFGATPPDLQVGDTIAWVNNDTVMHSVTARDHSFDLRLNPGQSANLTLAHAGRIPFYCLFHPSMRGTLVVGSK